MSGLFAPAHLIALLAFVISSSGTPGPNNILLMASGSTFGFARSARGLLGVNAGFFTMLIVVGLGLTGLLDDHPWVFTVMRPVAVLYLLWLAWHVVTAPPPSQAAAARPLGFGRMFVFQAINPKAWVMTIGSMVAYVRPSHGAADVILIACSFLVFGTPCTAAWVALGALTRRVIRSDRGFRVLNVVMGLLLAASAVAILVE